MGAVESRYDGTNWDEADGGLAGDVICIAGQTPTHGKKIITLKKKEILNHRIFDVMDEEGKVIFKFNATPNSFQWFELTSPHEKLTHPFKGQHQPLCRIAKAVERKTLYDNAEHYFVGDWTIYSYVHKAFDGQEMDKSGRMEGELSHDIDDIPLYRAYSVEFNHLTKDHALIKPFVKDPEGAESRGVAGDAVLKLEKVKSLTKEIYQVSSPDSDGLVGYWHWENSLTEHKIILEISKGVDLGLLGALAVLANVVKETEKFPFNVKSAFTQ